MPWLQGDIYFFSFLMNFFSDESCHMVMCEHVSAMSAASGEHASYNFYQVSFFLISHIFFTNI